MKKWQYDKLPPEECEDKVSSETAVGRCTIVDIPQEIIRDANSWNPNNLALAVSWSSLVRQAEVNPGFVDDLIQMGDLSKDYSQMFYFLHKWN